MTSKWTTGFAIVTSWLLLTTTKLRRYTGLVPTARSYHDACPIGRSLDVVGERWALLVVRELLLGPQRFGDLRHALPGGRPPARAARPGGLGGGGGGGPR